MEVFNKLKKLERKFDEFARTKWVVDETVIKCCVNNQSFNKDFGKCCSPSWSFNETFGECHNKFIIL